MIAPDYRGAGLSDRPLHGYDKQTMARDLVELVDDVAGRTIDHADLASLTLVDTPRPGTTTWDRIAANPRVWHLACHANVDMAERLVTEHERVYIDEFVRVRMGDPTAITGDDLDV